MKHTSKFLVFLTLLALIFGALGTAPAQAAASNAGQWTWADGANTISQKGIYGTEDIPAAANVPGARENSVSWSDASGNLWLFGGYGYDSANFGYLNDLWQFDPATGQWTWVDGANTINQNGTYGTEDVPAAANVPGARYDSVSWSDASGNLWLFGGEGRDSAGSGGHLNDLWKFDPGTGQWTWVDGANTVNQGGTYGTEDSPADANVPGARENSVSWSDASGNLWLFGGLGYDSAGSYGFLNDLWKFDPGTGQWTWADGATIINQSGTYGTEDIPADANVPGARRGSVSWSDASGNLWLFGGEGRDSAGSTGRLNDLWKFNPATGQWTWVDGANTVDQRGTYGTEDLPAAANVPGARHNSVSWSDASGNLWLFGGHGYGSVGSWGYLNDLWKFDPVTGQWTWADGATIINQSGIYGTEDIPAADNVPGARYASVSWSDASGNLWLFGGLGYDSTGSNGYLNDLWAFSDVHTVTFNANGGSGSMSPQVNNLPTALTANAFTRTGYSFSGWNTAADGSGTAYADGATYPFDADVTLYAQWTVNNYTVSFDAQGGSPTPGNQTVAYGGLVTDPGAPTRTGYTFNGWFTASSGGSQWNFASDTMGAADMTLYAQWTPVVYHLYLPLVVRP